mmetsp:Transcript_35079/g.101393  ORF Transcript_35079/g.101393 Transcript_35079/m.101393 type:complete len:229 (+) Transcript_35079:1-687(+)
MGVIEGVLQQALPVLIRHAGVCLQLHHRPERPHAEPPHRAVHMPRTALRRALLVHHEAARGDRLHVGRDEGRSAAQPQLQLCAALAPRGPRHDARLVPRAQRRPQPCELHKEDEGERHQQHGHEQRVWVPCIECVREDGHPPRLDPSAPVGAGGFVASHPGACRVEQLVGGRPVRHVLDGQALGERDQQLLHAGACEVDWHVSVGPRAEQGEGPEEVAQDRVPQNVRG